MWRQEHPQADLENVPTDMVMASDNALYQLDRVADRWAADTKRDPGAIRSQIKTLLEEKASAPGGGLFGAKLINVLEVNLELQARYGPPTA